MNAKLSPQELAALEWHKSHPLESQAEHLRREILGYLGDLPRILNEQGTEEAGKVAVSIGNCLCWIAATLDRGVDHYLECGLHETPQTIWALGRQFRAVGLKYWSAKKQEQNASIETLKAEIKRLSDRLTRMEAEYVVQGHPGGTPSYEKLTP